MKVLLLVTAFNGLSQAVFDELMLQDHDIRIVLGGNETALQAAVDSFVPDLILCPFLKQRISDDIWQSHLCIILHPGIRGDRGPSSLDWAIIQRQPHWGLTALQADAEMDAGDIWSWAEFPMRGASKASIYRHEITQAAILCVRDLLQRVTDSGFSPRKLDYQDADIDGQLRPLMKQAERAIDWQRDSTAEVIDKISAADSFPGVRDTLCGKDVYLFNVWPEAKLKGSAPKLILAKHQGAICVSTIDGAIWVGHLRPAPSAGGQSVKLPAAWILEKHLTGVPELSLPSYVAPDYPGFHEIRYHRRQDIGYLSFDFHNGAMGTEQCRRLLEAYQAIAATDVKVIALLGGQDFWCNGIHLNHIEHAEDPASESWANINAINDLVLAILTTRDKLTIAALNANAGAGGVMLAIACDKVIARDGVILNPHYRTMGLYGSEYWTYSLPRRVGEKMARELTSRCLPIGSRRAADINLVDHVLATSRDGFDASLHDYLLALVDEAEFSRALDTKASRRFIDEQNKPLADYREDELARMKVCFAGDEYHRARQDFVYKKCMPELPGHLASLEDFCR